MSQAPEKLWQLSCLDKFPGMRVLAWQGDVLYASRNYELYRAQAKPHGEVVQWEFVAQFAPAMWRKLSFHSRLLYRLARNGFHALAILPSGKMIAAVPGAIITAATDNTGFHITHRILRGTRPLHITATPDGKVYWGEYFNNLEREEVFIYGSNDGGETWDVAYVFPAGSVRHIHNIVHDSYENCLWILTGDEGAECQILRASYDLRSVDRALSGGQQTRAAAAVPAREGLYFSSDTPHERNHIYCLERNGIARQLAEISSSSISGCRVGNSTFFATMVEPSAVNPDHKVRVYGTRDGADWDCLWEWKKDIWPPIFQYGNAFFPDGKNESGVLALSTIAVQDADQQLSLWI